MCLKACSTEAVAMREGGRKRGWEREGRGGAEEGCVGGGGEGGVKRSLRRLT